MVFKSWREKRERGERFPVGFIKRKIVLIISSSPKGIAEPIIRDILREKWGISEPKGIKLHLAKLEDKKVLVKKQKKGFPNVWKLSLDYGVFKSLAKEFLKSEDELEFMRSKYAQSMINEDFVDHFAVDWFREFSRFLQTKYGSKMYGEYADKIVDNKLRDEFYSNLGEAFTKESFMIGEAEKALAKERLVEILRTSPTSLYNFLFPEELFEKGEIRVLKIGDYFLWPFISDMAYALPKGKGMKVKLELDYGNLTKSDVQKIADLISKKAKWLKSTLKTKTESEIYNPKPEEKHAEKRKLELKEKKELENGGGGNVC